MKLQVSKQRTQCICFAQMTLACASFCHVVSGTSRWSSLERTTECRFLQGETPQGASILVYHHICKTHSKMVTVYAFLLSLRWLALNFSSQFFRDRSPCPFIYFDSWNKPGDWKRYLDLKKRLLDEQTTHWVQKNDVFRRTFNLWVSQDAVSQSLDFYTMLKLYCLACSPARGFPPNSYK